MKKVYILFLGLLLVSTSCNIYRYEEHQSRVVKLGGTGIFTSTTADLNVSETRISHTETFSHQENEDDINIDYAKKYTLSSALIKYNADMLVGILYDVNTNDSYDKVTVTVTGYPATYVNFRRTTSEDSLLLATASALTDMETTKASMTTKERPKLSEYKGWQNSIALTYGLFLNPGIEYNGGWRFNKMFYVGFGTGYSFNLDDYSHYVPLFAQFKAYFWGDKRVNPYLGVCQGAAVTLSEYGDYYGIGSHTRGEVGVNFRLDQKVSLFLEYNIGTSPYLSRGIYSSGYFTYHYLYNGFKVGITF